jgi:Right handed beta helix region
MQRLHSLVWLTLALATLGTYRARAATAGGTLSANTSWSGTVQVLSNVIVPSGITLTIQAGTSVQLTTAASITAQANGTIDVQGTASNPVTFFPMAGVNSWGNITASGNNSSLTIRFAEISRGGLNLGSQSTTLIEDSFIHDVTSAISGNAARFVTLRRFHAKSYGSIEFNSGTVILAEDSLFENLTSANDDALEIQGGPPGSIIRRCTFRHALGNNTDAVDFNGTSGVLVQDCLIYDVSDKGISLGAAGTGGAADSNITISNCLIYSVDTGIAIKDGTTAGLFNNTIVSSPYGLRLYQKFTSPVDGGHVTNSFNNILWSLGTAAANLQNNSSLVASYSDFQGTNWPGTGNISSDPFFVNAALRDYRLATNSPAKGTGRNGDDMGPHFPVGAPMALSHPRIESVAIDNGVTKLRFYCDSEKSYTVQTTDAPLGEGWINVTNVFPTTVPRLVEVTDPIGPATIRFYRLVTPAIP